MAATSDPVGAGEPSPGEAERSECFDAPHPDGSGPDPYAALGRDALRGAIRDREADLADARQTLYATHDELAATALDLRICREALEHREADLAGARGELNALVDRHAHLALERDILEKAIGDREVDLAQARQDTAAAIDRGRRSEARVSALEAEVQALQDAAAERAAQLRARSEAPPPAQPIEDEPTSHWDDFKFFLKFLFNLGDSHPAGVDAGRRARSPDGAPAEGDLSEKRSTRREG